VVVKGSTTAAADLKTNVLRKLALVPQLEEMPPLITSKKPLSPLRDTSDKLYIAKEV